MLFFETSVAAQGTAFPQGGSLQTIVVGEHAATISQAIAMARDGDIIALLPGDYKERLVISKNITITVSVTSQRCFPDNGHIYDEIQAKRATDTIS